VSVLFSKAGAVNSPFSDTAENIAKAYRTKVDFEVLSDVPAAVCDDDLNRRLTDSIHDLDASIKVLQTFHAMGSEDFAFISQKVPSSYFCIGAGLQDSTQ
jgi:metal-dependent amidase/aminoacylase/carboxypeptidase family protein